MTAQQTEGRITYRWPAYRWLRFFALLGLTGLALSIVLDMLDGDFGWDFVFRVATAPCVILGAIFWQPRASADRTEIRPSERWRRIRWADVDQVRRPRARDMVVSVVTRDGKTMSTGFPPSYAEQLASPGDVELSP